MSNRTASDPEQQHQTIISLIIFAGVIAFNLQGCLFFDDNDPEPKILTGYELKALVPPLRNDSGTESIGSRDYRLEYFACDIDSCSTYIDKRISEGWTKADGMSFDIYGMGSLYKQTVTKVISDRTISLNVRCSRGYEGKYTSTLYINN